MTVEGTVVEDRLSAPSERLRRLGYRSMAKIPTATSDLDTLLQRVARGDAAAFAIVYDQTAARVYGLAQRVLRDTGYSEDTTQEIYLEVWRTATNYDPTKGSALAWLLTLAHRRAVDRVRSEQAASRRESRYGAASAEPPSDVVVDAVMVSEEQRRVVDCLGGLPEGQRTCVELAYYGGMTYVEVAQRLSINISTIKSRMREALRGLRGCLGAS